MPVRADTGGEGTDPTNRKNILKWGEWSAPLSGHFAPAEDCELITLGNGWFSETVWTWRKTSPPTGIPSLDRPARRVSLYRLRDPDRLFYNNMSEINV